MAAKKLHQHYRTGGKEKNNAKRQELDTPEQIAQDKAIIEQIKGLIGKKIKDPELAKKAALIISDMVKQDSEKSNKKNIEKNIKKKTG